MRTVEEEQTLQRAIEAGKYVTLINRYIIDNTAPVFSVCLCGLFTEEFDVSRADQVDLLNRSVDYFKTHESFDKKEFQKGVFQGVGNLKSLCNFDETYREDHELKLNDSFEISSQSVKKQSKVFKSILKLEKNFHICILGNRELIEQGVEMDGRKFYKIYFKEEGKKLIYYFIS